MNKTDYEKLKSVIQTANPEIMELKFGCKCQDKDANGNLYGKWTIIKIHEQGIRALYSDNSDGFIHFDVVNDPDMTLILGRPIRLADVLLAYQMRSGEWSNWNSQDMHRIYALLQGQQGWNLKDDNLDHQSEECKEFLIE